MRPLFILEVEYTSAVEEVVDVAVTRDDLHRCTGIAPDRQVLVHNGCLVRGGGRITVAGEAPEIEVYQRPAACETISVTTHFREEVVGSTYHGDATVSDLKRFLARRHQLAPARLVLTTLGVAMLEEDPLGAYAARLPVEVAVAVEDDGRPRKLVLASVSCRDGPGRITFAMDARDTLDVLLGKMERAGMVAEGEDITFASGDMVLENWRTFGYYKLPLAALRILERGEREIDAA